MNHPATRVLATLEMLQTRGRTSGAELSARLGVDRRTVRRYIALLEEIGIPVAAERGPAGGYELVAGFKLPPMMFTNDEALALALGLAAAKGLGLAAVAQWIAGAQAKLERVMPAAMRSRVRSAGESIAIESHGSHATSVDSAALAILSSAAHDRQGVRLRYRSASGEASERDFDPYGLAFSSGRWYAAGFCHLRKGVRTFRLDRVESAVPQARPFDRPAAFDVLAHLTLSIATLPRKFSIEVLLRTDLDSARRELFPAIGVLEPRDEGVLLHSQADDLDWFARELARLPWPFEILRPRALRAAIAAHAQDLLARQRK